MIITAACSLKNIEEFFSIFELALKKYTNIRKLSFCIHSKKINIGIFLKKVLLNFPNLQSLSVSSFQTLSSEIVNSLSEGISNTSVKILKFSFSEESPAKMHFLILKGLSQNKVVQKVVFRETKNVRSKLPLTPLNPGILLTIATNPSNRIVDFGCKIMDLSTKFILNPRQNINLDQCCCTLLGPEALVSRGDCLCVDLVQLQCASADAAICILSYFEFTGKILKGQELQKKFPIKITMNTFNTFYNLFPLYINEEHWKIAKTKLQLLYPVSPLHEIVQLPFSIINVHIMNKEFLPKLIQICQALYKDYREIMTPVLNSMINALDTKPRHHTKFFFLVYIAYSVGDISLERAHWLIGKHLKEKYFRHRPINLDHNKKDFEKIEEIDDFKATSDLEEIKKCLLEKAKIKAEELYMYDKIIVKTLEKRMQKLRRLFSELPPYNCLYQLGVQNKLEANLFRMNAYLEREKRDRQTVDSLPKFIFKTLKRKQALVNKTKKKDIYN